MTAPEPVATCTFPGCPDPVRARGLCRYHDLKAWRVRRERGYYQPVDSHPAAAHLRLLRARGWTWLQLEPAARMGRRKLNPLAAGHIPTLRRCDATRITAITPIWQRTTLGVPTVGTARRLSALLWQGWTRGDIETAGGPKRETLHAALRRGTIEARSAAAVDDFYQTHIHHAGPHQPAAKAARAKGNAIPDAAWDDIDDPHAQPNLGRADRRYTVDPADIQHFAGYGWDDARIARELGAKLDTVQAARRRARTATAA